jgi:dedicator of cytokinesis protein 3
MPWRPLPRIAFAVAIYPFQPSSPADLPLELGDELYIIEQGGTNGSWYRGYLVAPPSLLAGLTSVKGQTLEARVFSGIFPRSCVEVREVLGETGAAKSLPDVATPPLDDHISANLRESSGSGPSRDGEDTPTRASDKRSSKRSRHSRQHSRQSSNADSARRISAIKTGTAEGKNNGDARESVISQKSHPSTLPLTPVSLSPRDPNAPKPAAPVPMLKIGDETPTSSSEPLVDEIASCLREWHSTNLHELLLARKYSTLEKMSNIVQQLDLCRRQLLHNVLTQQERLSLRERAVWNLVQGNRMLSGEVIVRGPDQRGRLLMGDDSAIDITKLQSTMSLLESYPTTQPDIVALHHMLLEIKSIGGGHSAPITLTMYLYSKSTNGDLTPLSETYALDIPSHESLVALARGGKAKTLFTDLSSTDIGEGAGDGSQVYLVMKVHASIPPNAPSAAPESRSSTSREAVLANRSAATLNSSAGGSIRSGGRRSLMWAQKGRSATPVDREKTISESGQTPPRTGSSLGMNGARSQTGSTAPSKQPPLVRTIGVGVLDVGYMLRGDKDSEHVINIWSPVSMEDEEDGQEEDIADLAKELLRSPDGRYVRTQRAGQIHAHLHPFVSPDAETLIRKNPTLMHSVTQSRKIGFSGAPTQPRSDIYVTLSEAVIPQNAILSHPNGSVSIPQPASFLNLQLTLEVRNSIGERIEHCIYPSSNSTGHTAWRTMVTEKENPWNQTIRLRLPADQVPGAHLIMSVADAPSFPFALAWMPLWDQQAFLRDGHHSLLLHAYDKATSSIVNGKGAYLSLPWTPPRKSDLSRDDARAGPFASLTLGTYLCSTEYSQDQMLLALINWREYPSEQVLDLLKRVVFVPEIEIVKLLNDVFDALFGIIVDHAGNDDFEDLVFRDLVTVLGIVHDRRFNLGPLVDKYAGKQFNCPLATPCLIAAYNRLLLNPADPQHARDLRAAFKVGRHILKFIVYGREQQKAREADIGLTNVQSSFHRDVKSMFKALESLMQNPAPILVGSKTLAVQHFHTWLPELQAAFTNDEILTLAISFMEACKDVQGKLVLYKLILIQNFVQLDIFASQPQNRTLFIMISRWLSGHWGETHQVNEQWSDQVRLCASVVSELLAKDFGSDIYQYLPKIVSSYCVIQENGVNEKSSLSLLFSKAFPFQVKPTINRQKFNEALLELAALIAAIFKVPSPRELPFQEPELGEFMSQTLRAHTSVLNCDAYPRSWLSLNIYHHRSTMKSLEYLGYILTTSYLPLPDEADNFNTELWKSFFMALLKLVGSDALALETFPEQKRRAVWKIAGDVRENGAALLRRSWESIGWDTSPDDKKRYGLQKMGGYQVQYVPSLVAPIIELCLSVHGGLRHVAVEILLTMILSEWALSEDLAMVEAEMIDSLDRLFKSRHLNESITQKLFIGELLDLFEPMAISTDDPLFVAVKEVVATIDELLDLLVAAHDNETNGSFNTMHTLKLMEFMKDMRKEDIFIRYVHDLAQSQLEAKHPTEAGLALQFHADLYTWDSSKTVDALERPFFIEQSAFDRKEALYFEVIQKLEDGKDWTHALACYRELAEQYEHNVLDFSKLARTHRSMAKIQEAIAKDERQMSRYFRVIYKGLGFPASLRDKQFIFEGSPSERLTAFTDRMQKQHPAAQLVSPSDVEDLEGQFLQISGVSPHRDLQHPVYQRMRVPQSVREHFLVSNPGQFSVTSRRHTAINNVKEQWVEKLIFTTAEPFPNILRRSEVITTEESRLTPIQTAIERTWRKTGELYALEKRIEGTHEQPTILSETLSASVDPSSSSTVAAYRQFLPQKDDTEEEGDTEEESAEKDTELDPSENALRIALLDHVLTIKRCLGLYTQPAHQATQAELTRKFEITFGPELAILVPASKPSAPEVQLMLSPPGSIISVEPYKPLPDLANRVMSPEPRASINESHLDKPGTDGKRLSLGFFRRGSNSKGRSTSTYATSSAAPPVDPIAEATQPTVKVNGVSSPEEQAVPSDAEEGKSTGQPRAKSEARRSFFGANTAAGALQPTSPSEDGDAREEHSITGRSSVTGDSSNPNTPGAPSSVATGGSITGSVKKRLSLLKIGKKASKASVGSRVGSLAEEDT